MGADTKDLEAFQAKLRKLRDEELVVFNERALRKLANDLLRLVIPATPVAGSTYEEVKGNQRVVREGGTLKRGWVSKTHEEAESGKGAPGASEIAAYLNGVQITRRGNAFEIEIVNPVEYAAYVEYGHRQTPGRYVPAIGARLVANWIEGKHFVQKSEQVFEPKMQATVQAELEKFLKEALND